MGNLVVVIKCGFTCHGGVRAVKHKGPEARSTCVATDIQ